MVYCAKCYKTWKYNSKTEKSCRKCKSDLKYKCGKCKTKLYPSLKSLKSHLIYCKKDPKICCDYCDYKTYNKYHVETHIQAKHLPKDPNANKCSRCEKSFSQKSSLIKHLKICGKSEKLNKNSNILARFNKTNQWQNYFYWNQCRKSE